ncbi:MAG: PAS domain S-box protein [Deltaproteobacteria bacterium]|nr:PAS domain S-box protein [Deltaproteobacteria bacterium]
MTSLKGLKIAVLGGGSFCKGFLQTIHSELFMDQTPVILGVADKNIHAEGIEYARQKKIFTTDDYKELFRLKGLDIILELTRDNLLAMRLRNEIPSGIRLIDHFEAVFLWNSFLIEEERVKISKDLEAAVNDIEKIRELFDLFSKRINEMIQKRTDYSLEIERDLFEHESTMYQIIQGSTIPTFVINRDHIVTYWNRALEKLSGYPAAEIVGTNKQWIPFREKERPTMADAILSQFEEGEISRYYGEKWSKSKLIEGAYEAEEFFPNLGESGIWTYFTAAPIRRADGEIIGAIETLWDTTIQKKAEQELERYNREFRALESIYSALSSSFKFEDRIKAALEELKKFLSAESICLFLLDEDNLFHLKYCIGVREDCYSQYGELGQKDIADRVIRNERTMIFEDLREGINEEIGLLDTEGLKSLLYIPMISDKKEAFGIIRIGIKRTSRISPEAKIIVELIINRIGITIRNSMLQEQYIRSEEKYRSLFNNDPNPIFILNRKTLNIFDTNRRAEISYGYSRDELIGTHFPGLGDPNDEELIDGLKNLKKGQSILFSKKRYYKKGRIPIYINVNVSYAEYQNYDVLIAATTDITESVEKETQLVQASKMTTLGLMASGMAHEINQPLNVIQVCADYFQKMVKRKEQISHEDLESLSKDMSENVARATGIIKHVRDFARQSPVVVNRVNINKPIRDVFKVLGHQVKAHRVELILDLDPEIPFIMAEHNRLEQVFINLVTNAIDALDEKEGNTAENDWKKQLKIKSFFKEGKVVVTVSDNGIGMTKEVMDKIFEPFFTSKEIGKGTGLGVSISHGIVKDYKGDIQVESKIGEGTTFTLSFPAIA